MKKISFGLTLFVIVLVNFSGNAQNLSWDVGLRFQKTQDLYYENGVTTQFNLNDRWAIGGSYYTSRLGSALGSNAIKQDNFIVSAAYSFRPQKRLRPFIRANTGYFIADYEADIFDDLTSSSVLASVDVGIVYRFKTPLKIGLSVGYNAVTGSGSEGAGTLYPIFYQTSVTWDIFKASSK